jgi:hypothetical protein
MSPPEKKPHEIEISVNNKEVTVPDKELSGAEIKQYAQLPVEFHLYLEQGSKLVEIADAETIKVHKGEKFRAVSGQDVS